MINKPPDWKKIISPGLLIRAMESKELHLLLQHAGKECVYWDKFKYYSPPAGFSIEEAWAYLKFSRQTSREQTQVSDKNQNPFWFTPTKTMYQELSFIDSNTSGLLSTDQKKPTEKQKNQLIISGLSEEAIASSQIEGASTSMKIAKEMILSQRKSRNRDEQMILNNYQVMQKLMDWKDLQLSKEMLLDIQKHITTRTLDDENDSGRFRSDSDDIQVVGRMLGTTVFTPPESSIFSGELDKLINFANSKDEEFIHPIIKASILHFWLAYLHPFVDRNGRTARALFYWYLLKNDYWLFQYLSVSKAIKKTRTQYDEAYLKTELDDNDLTYFILFILKSIKISVKDFVTQYEKRIKEDKQNETITKQLSKFNERQVSLLRDLQNKPEKTVEIKGYQSYNQIAYQTARTDLMTLASKGLLTRFADNNKYLFVPNNLAIKKLLK